MTVTEYLDRAAQAGLVDMVDGHRYVADAIADPVDGGTQCLVEFAEPPLHREAGSLATLCSRLHERHPAAEGVLMRVAGEDPLPAPWKRRLTYLRHGGSTAGGTRDPAITIRPAVPSDDDRVSGWLAKAIGLAYPEEIVTARHSAVTTVLTHPGRRSLIAESAGTAVGHATLLTGEQDEVTGEDLVELFDILVQPDDLRRAATTALVAASAALADGLPLLGHVVHPPGPAPARQHANAVVESLRRGGWSVDHAFWWCANP